MPARAALAADDYRSARRLNRAAADRGIPRQTWGIMRKIREVDTALEGLTRCKVFETHPEVAFVVANGGAPLTYKKKDSRGHSERLAILERNRIEVDVTATRELLGRRNANPDDILDAAIAAWTASRLAKNIARRLGDDLPDARQRPMQIWA